MPTLHKFKLLATQCAVSGTQTQSPTTSPVIHLRHHRRRRRKTLRMLLSRASDRGRLHQLEDNQDELQDEDQPEKRVRRKLKDLFVSSPPFEDKERKNDEVMEMELLSVNGSVSGDGGNGGESGGVLQTGRRGGSALRPASSTFRYRLLRRAWRPVLVTIPE